MMSRLGRWMRALGVDVEIWEGERNFFEIALAALRVRRRRCCYCRCGCDARARPSACVCACLGLFRVQVPATTRDDDDDDDDGGGGGGGDDDQETMTTTRGVCVLAASSTGVLCWTAVPLVWLASGPAHLAHAGQRPRHVDGHPGGFRHSDQRHQAGEPKRVCARAGATVLAAVLVVYGVLLPIFPLLCCVAQYVPPRVAAYVLTHERINPTPSATNAWMIMHRTRGAVFETSDGALRAAL
jgi:hypothetical protein